MILRSVCLVIFVGALLSACNDQPLLETAGTALRDAQTAGEVEKTLNELRAEGGADKAIADAYCSLLTPGNSSGQTSPSATDLAGQLADLAEKRALGISPSVIQGKAQQFATAVQLGQQLNGGVATYYLRACGTFQVPGE